MSFLTQFLDRRSSHEKDSDKRLTSLEEVFGRQRAVLQQAFSDASVIAGAEKLPTYPARSHLGESGLHAFVQMQNLEPAAVPPFLKMVGEGARDVDFLRFERGACTTFVKLRDYELGGRNVWLLTNDVELLIRLAAAQFGPPPPWLVFPELGPFLTYNQGAPEYWYHGIWQPFWSSLSPEARDIYIDEHAEAALAYMGAEEWEDWIHTTRRADPEYKAQYGL